MGYRKALGAQGVLLLLVISALDAKRTKQDSWELNEASVFQAAQQGIQTRSRLKIRLDLLPATQRVQSWYQYVSRAEQNTYIGMTLGTYFQSGSIPGPCGLLSTEYPHSLALWILAEHYRPPMYRAECYDNNLHYNASGDRQR